MRLTVNIGRTAAALLFLSAGASGRHALLSVGGSRAARRTGSREDRRARIVPSEISGPRAPVARRCRAAGSVFAACTALLGFVTSVARAQPQVAPATPIPLAAPADPDVAVQTGLRLADVRMRDACVFADPDTQTYTIIAAARGAGVRAYTSKDLLTWEGPRLIFQAPPDLWGDIPVRGVWAPELHRCRGRFYLFLTFDTRHLLAEQWRDWLPRVVRGSQVLVSDVIDGPYRAFAPHSTLPPDMMTFDGTLFVEDGVPYMVFCHEWVQIKDGTMCFVRLQDDLAATAGEPVRLFHGSDAPWAKKSGQYGCFVTDGPAFHRSVSGRLFMLWSSGSDTGYTTGVAISDSGRLAGPWRQQAEPIFAADGGHGFIFHRFDGQLMLVLHTPNKDHERAQLFELEDTGETLRILRPFPATP